MRKYYVATNGSDQGPGDEKLPFLTIQKAADTAHAGDQIIIRAGIYREYVVIRNSGTKEYPIVFSGERGADGSWKTIIDPGIPLSNWVPAPEIGRGVFKTDILSFNPKCMTVNGKLVIRIADRIMQLEHKGAAISELSTEVIHNPEIGGFALLNLSEKAISRHTQLGGKSVKFWDGVEIMYGFLEGMLYIRFRTNDQPNAKEIKASDDRPGISINNQSSITIENLMIRCANKSLVIEGSEARNNIIRQNCFKHGICRIKISAGSSDNIISNNVMSLDYLNGDVFGAGSEEKKLPRHRYTVFKYIVGPKTSDDKSILIENAGKNNEIYGNIIYKGLIGIHAEKTANLRVHGNVIFNMSSIGLVTHPGVYYGEFYNNLIYDCGINIRIHKYGNAEFSRKEFHCYNLLYQPENAGMQIFIFPEPGAPSINNQEINIYNNTIYGGQTFLHSKGTSEALNNSQLSFRFINNILNTISGYHIERITNQGFEIFSGNLIPTTNADQIPDNLVIKPDDFSKHFDITFKKTALGEIPYFKLAVNSMARKSEIDVSKTFSLNDKQYGPWPLPVKKNQSKAPALGAQHDDEAIESLYALISILP